MSNPGRGGWIWIRPPRTEGLGLIPRGRPDFSADRNLFVHFRKTFEWTRPARKPFIVRVSADGRYRLYLNGVPVGRGPARCHPDFQRYDTYDLKPLLRPGGNTLAALVHSYGVDTSWYELPRGSQALYFGAGGFFLQGDSSDAADAADTADAAHIADSDGSWKFLVSDAWERDTPFSGTGFLERFDASREPTGWLDSGFDDSGWTPSFVQRIPFPQGGADIVPFPNMADRGIAPLTERMTHAARVERRGQEGIVADFGHIVHGRPRLSFAAPRGGKIVYSYGETLGPDGFPFVPGAIPGISIPASHEISAREGPQEFLQFEPAGFRYLHIRAADAMVFSAIEVEETGYPETRAGSFACSDPDLSRIWDAGARTAALCRQDGMVDCPSREQRQWTGDVYIQSLIGYVIESDPRIVRKFLFQGAETQRPDGMIAMASCCDLHASGATYIPDFALLWILALENYVLHTGDTAACGELLPAASRILGWFARFAGSDGILRDVPGWIFIDWSSVLDRRGACMALNALHVGALRAAAACARRMPRGAGATDAEHWDACADSAAGAAHLLFWDEARGLYRDAVHGNREAPSASAPAIDEPVFSQQANSAALAFGIAPPELRGRILDALCDSSRLRLTKAWRWDIDRPFDPAVHIVLAQPFFMHFLHDALAREGRLDALVANIRERWLPLLETEDTFRESWQTTEMTSRCHAFSATPTYDLSARVLGVRPTADGYSRFSVSPWIDGLEWARGRVPTRCGAISVEWARSGEMIDLEICVPEGLVGLLEIPGRPGDGETLMSGTNRFRIPSRR